MKSVFKSLNKPQKTAVLKVLMSKDYVLIEGYPGTGMLCTLLSMGNGGVNHDSHSEVSVQVPIQTPENSCIEGLDE